MFKRNKVKAACVLSPLLSLLWATGSQAGDTANITVTATIVNRTCTPDWTGDPSKTKINLGTIDAKNMAAKGNIGGSQEFTLTLTDCTSDVHSVKVTATGSPDPNNNILFKNTGTATGVGVFIKGGPNEDTLLKPNGTGEGDYTVSDNTVAMKFKAFLERDSGTAPTSGSVTVPLTLNMNYE